MPQPSHPFPLTRRHALGLGAAGLLAPLLGARPALAQRLATRQELAPHLYELAYSPRQRALFVASAGGFSEGAPPSRVFRLDPQTLAVQAEIPLPLKGFGVILDDTAGRLYVSHAIDGAVSAIDVAANSVVGTLTLAPKVRGEDGKEEAPYGLRRLALDPARGRLYLAGLSLKDGVLYVVDTRALRLTRTVSGIGPGASGIALHPSGDRVFVSTLAGQLVTVNTESLAVVKQFAAGGAEQPLNLAWDAPRQRLLAVDQGLEGIRKMQEKNVPGFTSRNPGNRVVALDPETGKLLAEGPVPEGPVALLADAGRNQLYVSSRAGGAVTVLALDSLERRASVPLPVHPNSLALDEQGKALFATVKAAPKRGSLDLESVARIAL